MKKEICPLCNSSENQQIESKIVFGGKKDDKYLFCEKCDLYYLFPFRNQLELDKFYKYQFEEFMENRSGEDSNWADADKHSEISQRDANRRISFLQNQLEKSHNVLEVGASTGFMIDTVKNLYPKINCIAIEPSNHFCNFMTNKGIEAYQSSELIPKNKKFDLIMHFFVIAHVIDFKSFLTEYYDKLNIGGKMIFETPSATDPLRSLYNIPEFNNFYWQVAHLVSFTNKSMEKLLEEMGYKYKIYPHQRYDLSNHMVWMQTGKAGGRNKYSHIFSEDLENEYKNNLEQNWKCDTIIVEIEKI